MSKFKAGQTIPAKFVLKNAAGAVCNRRRIPTFTRTGHLGACDSQRRSRFGARVGKRRSSSITWDGAQYHYNWSTKGSRRACIASSRTSADGTARSVDICLTK